MVKEGKDDWWWSSQVYCNDGQTWSGGWGLWSWGPFLMRKLLLMGEPRSKESRIAADCVALDMHAHFITAHPSKHNPVVVSMFLPTSLSLFIQESWTPPKSWRPPWPTPLQLHPSWPQRKLPLLNARRRTLLLTIIMVMEAAWWVAAGTWGLSRWRKVYKKLKGMKESVLLYIEWFELVWIRIRSSEAV